MRRVALTTAAILMSLSIATAQRRPAAQDVPESVGRQSAATITLAMGPISAPQKRNPNEGTSSLSGSTSPSDLTPHKTTKHRRRHSSRN